MDVKGMAAITRLAELDASNIMLLEWSEAQPLVIAAMKKNSLTRPALVRGRGNRKLAMVGVVVSNDWCWW